MDNEINYTKLAAAAASPGRRRMPDDLLDTVEKALALDTGCLCGLPQCAECRAWNPLIENRDVLRSLLARCREAEKELAALRERHAEDVEHAFAAGVTFTATCTDQMSAGLRKWPEYKSKWARREP